MLEMVPFHFCPKCGQAALKPVGIKACRCEACGFLYYHNPAPAVVAVIEDGERIMLTTRVNEPHRGRLALPGGFIDYEESLEDALVREIHEELDLTVRELHYLCSHWDQYAYQGNLYHTLVAYYVVRVEDLDRATPQDDISSFEMVCPEDIDLENLAFEADRVALRNYLAYRERLAAAARKAAYTKKAEKYARYRWDYAPEAIQAIYDCTGLGKSSSLADIGAGTGILTRHFAGYLRQVYAVEPNPEMRRAAQALLVRIPGCVVLDTAAEATGLPDASVDVITVAQAIHWFEPEAARREFWRILKPGGWLVILRNYGTDEALEAAVGAISTAENGVRPVLHAPHRVPEGYFYGAGDFEKRTYPFVLSNDWEIFLGAMLSTSFYPDEDDPAYAQFEAAARTVFERFSQGGRIATHGVTELFLGRPLHSSEPAPDYQTSSRSQA